MTVRRSLACAAVGAVLAASAAFIVPADAAPNDGAGIVDSRVQTTVTGPSPYSLYTDEVHVEYPAIQFFGTLTVAGESYTGGFWVTGVSWDGEIYTCFNPTGLMHACVPGYRSQPTHFGPVTLPAGLPLTGNGMGQTVGGTCGGSGSYLQPGDTTVLHLGCGLSVDGKPGGWVWIDATMTGQQLIANDTGLIAGVYTSSSV